MCDVTAFEISEDGAKPVDPNSSKNPPEEYCQNDYSEPKNSAFCDKQATASANGNPNDHEKPQSHKVQRTKTYKNNTKINKAQIRRDPPVTDAEIQKLIKKRDKLAKKMMKNKNVKARKAVTIYYDRIIHAFKNTANEHVMNQQLVRMMQATNDIRDIFCELVYTDTKLGTKHGVLLINGQIRMDGAAFAKTTNNLKAGQKSDIRQRLTNKLAAEAAGDKYESPKNAVTSDREQIMSMTKNYDEKELENKKTTLAEKYYKERENIIKNHEGFLKFKKTQMGKEDFEAEEEDMSKELKNKLKKLEYDYTNKKNVIMLNNDFFHGFKKEYRIVFEPHINEFEQCLTYHGFISFEIQGKRVFRNLRTPEYFRLMQQFGKDTYDADSINAAMIMAKKVGFDTPEGTAACHQQVLNEMFAHIGKNKNKQQRLQLRQDYFKRFNDPNDDLSETLAKNFKEALDQIEECFIKNHPKGARTEFKHRFDLNNEDPRTVAAIAYVHVTEGTKNEECRGWSLDQRIEKTKKCLANKTERVGILRLSQDGLNWILKVPETTKSTTVTTPLTTTQATTGTCGTTTTTAK